MEPILSGVLQQQQAETAMKVQMSVLRKSMEVEKNVGEFLVGLIEGAGAQPVKTLAKMPGLGDKLDVFA